MYAVRAFGVTGKSRGILAILGPIIHPVTVPVPEDDAVTTGIAFPRLVKSDDHLARHRPVKDTLSPALHTVHHQIVKKQLPATFNLYWFFDFRETFCGNNTDCQTDTG
jgi:hypothetical protein